MHRYARGPPPPRPQAPRPIKVDRVKACPSLLRVFVKAGSHHADTDFSTNHLPTRDECQVYTWRDSTVREVLNLVRDADPTLRATTLPLARFSVRIVYWDANADRYTSQEIAVANLRDLLQPPGPVGASRQGPQQGTTNPRLDRTLADAKLVVGDFLDIAFIAPEVHAPPAAAAVPRGGPSTVPPGVRTGSQAAPGHGANGPVFGRRDDSTWGPSAGGRPPPSSAGTARAPLPRSGPAQWGAASQRGPYGPPGRHAPPQDQGWGPRRPSHSHPGGHSFESRDRPPPPVRRRSSRSPSPVRNGYDRPPHRRSPSPVRRSASPPPRRRVDDTDDLMRD
ncbi:hypothetical protein JCM3774_000037 [Rhodotorula dairenensis]